tara:strand:- start:1892 stop:2524 length:633 start_codon:yes stop_codon:yes gene_type:complete
MITLKLLGSDASITKTIHAAIAKSINEIISKKKRKVEAKLKRAVRFWVTSTPEIQSLLERGIPNSLNSQFGLRNMEAQTAVDAIVDSIVNSAEIKISKINNKLNGKIEFNFQPSDLRNLLGLPEGHVITEKGQDLHWLDWLLTKGNTTVVIGYTYSNSGKGRSGVGSMKKGGSFRVNPQFSGTVNNNFITRSLETREQRVISILSEVLSA